MRKLLFAAIGLLLCLGAGAQERRIWPVEDWQKANPEKYGFSSDKFENVLRPFIINKTKGTGVLIIAGGERIFAQGALDRLSYIASCRKSILSMMYGKYVEDGTIDLSLTMEQLGIDDIGGLLPIEKQATILDLITARSGVYHPASNAGDNANKPERGTKKPGEYFIYNNWDFNVAGAVFEQLTGKNIYDAFWEDIGSRIGMQDWNREVHVKGGDLTISQYPSYHFHFSTRDMARLGYLMLRDGLWGEDNPIISKSWHDRIISEASTWEEVNTSNNKEGRYSYGYMWWLFDDKCKLNSPLLHGAYTAWGAMGQYITVIPALDMVIAFKTDRIYGRKTRPEQYLEFLDVLLSCRL